jgi:hypothetical protein
MRRTTLTFIAAAMFAGGAAIAKLPPPTPEEQAAAAAKKAKEQEQLEKEKALLEKAQDRVVARYRSDKSSGALAGGNAPPENMPKTTSELPRGVGPNPARPQSAEAHSAPAK